MEIQHILIFVLVGAVCMVIVTGGALSMSSDDAPSSTQLAGGAAVGGALGAAFSALGSLGSLDSLTSSDIMSGGGFPSFSAGAPEMKVGLPSF
jgi:hypothetical protein